MTPFEAVIGIIIAVERFTAGAITPLWERLNWDKFYLMYVAWVIGSGLVFLTGINLLPMADYHLPDLAGRIVTALIAGGGANLLHDALDKKKV